MPDHGAANGDKRRRKRRWADAAPSTSDATPPPAAAAAPIDSKAKALALQESIRARLEALKAKTAGATAAAPAASTSKRPLSNPPSTSSKRAKHYELDLNVTGPTFNKKPEAPKPKVNPYLAHQQQPESAQAEDSEHKKEQTKPVDEENDGAIVDDRVQASKLRQRHKALRFVEPGTFVEIAERKRRKAVNAEQSGFVSGRKAGTYVSQQNMANIYGSTEVISPEDHDERYVGVRPEANEKTTMPHVMEWWDLELLPTKLKKQVSTYEGKALAQQTQMQLQRLGTTSSAEAGDKAEKGSLQDPEAQDLQQQCLEHAALSYSKTAALVQHIVPVRPPNAKEGPPVEPTLYLTKRELKRQRKLRRQEKQRDLQDLQAAGLVEPPEPRLTLQNFIRVLGDQAFVDPSQMEQKVLEQVEARQRAHLERNEQNKLTKEQRAAKLAKKLQEDTSQGVHVALFYVKDMSHPYHRTKVDLNAQQYNITGGVLECEVPSLACVICEGGPKAIKRYTRLMTVRMKWKGPDHAADDDDEEEDNHEKSPKFNPNNTCQLVWTGMAAKRFFKGFVFQACETSDQASKILRAKGVGHYWDQVLAHASGRGERFQLKLAESDGDEDIVIKQEGNSVKQENDAMEE